MSALFEFLKSLDSERLIQTLEKGAVSVKLRARPSIPLVNVVGQ